MLTLGLIGYPVSHSLSPRLHVAALQAMGLSGSYELYSIPPMPEGSELLEDLLQQLRHRQIHGLNVTVPHKEWMLKWVDRLGSQAQAINAVNTLYIDNDRLVGDNTDGQGFWADLSRVMPAANQQETALILGAGGSARAVAFTLTKQGYRLAIAARNLDRAMMLVHSLDLSGCTVDEFSPGGVSRLLAASDHKPDLIVNCTPLGMYPLIDQSAWPDTIPLPEHSFIYDLVYNPVNTSLMRQAARAGIPAANGFGMLVEQAALALEYWTGLPVPRQAMFAAAPEYNIHHDPKFLNHL